MRAVAIAALLISLPLSASAASFDCAAAGSRIEKLICADAELAALDVDLASEYRRVQRATVPEWPLRRQREWVAKRNACDDRACVHELYLTRLRDLREVPSYPPVEPGDITEYVVRCDPSQRLLTIEEAGFTPEPENALPSQVADSNARTSELRVRADQLTSIGGTDEQPTRLASGRRQLQCRLGGSLYRVVIDAHIHNGRIMGECGAAEPSIAATVIRNSAKMPTFSFEECRTHRRVHRIQVDERTRSVRILVTLNSLYLPVRVQRTLSLSNVPVDIEQALFDAYPTGDVDVDLIIAVRKRDQQAVETALARGASPNAQDSQGSTPLGYLKTAGAGNVDAVEPIARMLLAKGANPNVRFNQYFGLLEYLIGGVPPAVIDAMLEHGADPKDDLSIRSAAASGDPRLVEKLLKAGADPNQKGSDDATALWYAAVNGFYTFSGRPNRPIEDYVACLRLLLKHGARTEEAHRYREGMLSGLVGSFSKDARLKLVVSELIPYSSTAHIKSAYDLLRRSGANPELLEWLKQYVR